MLKAMSFPLDSILAWLGAPWVIQPPLACSYKYWWISNSDRIGLEMDEVRDMEERKWEILNGKNMVETRHDRGGNKCLSSMNVNNIVNDLVRTTMILNI